MHDTTNGVLGVKGLLKIKLGFATSVGASIATQIFNL